MKDNIRFSILFLIAILWICKPIPYEDVVKYQSVPKEVIRLRAGAGDGQDSTGSTGKNPNLNVEEISSFIDPRPKLGRQEQPVKEPKVPKEAKTQADDPNQMKVRYKQPGAPSPGGLGAANYDEDLPTIPDDENTISDRTFWDNVQGVNSDSDDESEQTENLPPTSPPTRKLSKKYIKENNFLTKDIEPRTFLDWEGDSKVIKSRELKKSVFAHGYEAGVTGTEDLIEGSGPIQTDPKKHQRENCSKITDTGAKNFSDKIVDIAQSRKVGMVKFKMKMPYFDLEMANF